MSASAATSDRLERRKRFWGQKLKQHKQDPKHTPKGAQKLRKKPRKSVRTSVKDGEGEEGPQRGRTKRRHTVKAMNGKKSKTGGGQKGGKNGISSRGFRSVPASGESGVKLHSKKLSSQAIATERTVKDLLEDSASESETEQTSASDKIKTHSSEPETATKRKSKKMKRQRRYILFVGNLPKHATREEIVSHFEKRGVHIREFRLLTHKDTGKSKGCGFMELGSDKEMQNALKFHRMRMKTQHVNIEVTCGGGGKSEQRRAKIKEKNKNLRLKKAKAHPVVHKPQN